MFIKAANAVGDFKGKTHAGGKRDAAPTANLMKFAADFFAPEKDIREPNKPRKEWSIGGDVAEKENECFDGALIVDETVLAFDLEIVVGENGTKAARGGRPADVFEQNG